MTNLPGSPGWLLHLPQYMGELYGLSEVGLALWRRSGGGTRSADRGSLYMLWAVITLSIIGAVAAAILEPDAYSPMLRSLLPLGLVLFALGLILRWYAIFYLGRFFTVDVAIAADHRVIDTGPYRLIRHPSYSGAILALLGLGMCYCNWLSLELTVIPPALALLWRINIEEKALTSALGEAYANYKAHTRRLIPFVY
jgi:protein-S-isoprenylcysteine O-methyltransferase